MGNINSSIRKAVGFSIYIFVNSIFIYKYSTKIISIPIAAVAIYVVFAIALFTILYAKANISLLKRLGNTGYYVLVALAAILLAILMFQFNPQQISVSRYPAMNDWISNLFNGEFPYGSDKSPSGFPFLFIMALPFYCIGDAGLFQIFTFILFAIILQFRYRLDIASRYSILLLLLTAPIFIYEVVVRSEIFSNIVIIIIYLELFEIMYKKYGFSILPFLVIVAGLLLSTRGIVLLIFIIYVIYKFKNNIMRGILVTSGIAAVFISTLIPFIVWDSNLFYKSGPLSIQAAYIPLWLLITSIAVAIISGLLVKGIKDVYYAAAILLFSVVLIVFIINIYDFGWIAIIQKDIFDISYFAFCLPLLLTVFDIRKTMENKDMEMINS